jgi:hypothetical protein
MSETVAEVVKTKTLVQKLCEAGAAVGWIEKGGYNEFHKYKYATEADIVSTLRGELFKRHVFIFPNVVRYVRTPIEIETMKWDDTERKKVPSVRKTAITEMDIEWTFSDGESGEEKTVMVPGVGEDSMDKGLYKAFTGAEKYLLMKSFLLPTGDDPEHDGKDEYETDKEAGKVSSKAVGEAKVAAMREKASQKPTAAVQALFYVEPESQNGHFAEFINISEFAATRADIEDSLRMVFTTHKAKKTKNGTALVPSAELLPLLEKLAGDMGLTVKKLDPNA